MHIAVAAVLSAGCFYFRELFWPLAWIAPAPILWVAYRATSYRIAVWTTVLSIFLWGLLVAATLIREAGPAVLLLLAPRIVLVATLYSAAMALSRFAFLKLPVYVSLLAFPVLGTAISFVAVLLAGGDTAGQAANSQVDAPILIQSASLFGSWAIEFLLALFSNACVMVALNGSSAKGIAATTLTVLTLNVGYGYWRMQQPGGPKIRVAAAAQDLPLSKPLPLELEVVSGIAIRYSAEARSLATQGARMVVFPELMAILQPEGRAGALAPLQDAANQSHIWLTAGFAEVDSVGKSYNVALTMRPNFPIERYVKRHTLQPLDPSIRGTKSGYVDEGRSVAICKDLDFPATMRADAQAGVNVMLVPAADFESDGWAHARMAILRSVENGFSMIRAARNGVLTITDWRGKVLARADSGREQIRSVIAEVPVRSEPTLYRRSGDFLAWSCLALSMALIVIAAATAWSAWRRRRLSMQRSAS